MKSRRCWSPITRHSRGGYAAKAIEHAIVLEFIAKMDFRARTMAPDAPRPDQFLIDKHYFRKHGQGAYYGQK